MGGYGFFKFIQFENISHDFSNKSSALSFITEKEVDHYRWTQNLVGVSKDISSMSNNLANNATEQASAVEETSASVEEIVQTIASNTSKSTDNLKETDLIISGLEKGNLSMTNVIKSMEDILESNGRIQELQDVIASVGEHTKVIDEIVFQTKLLSFNASVEAERAGEHGRGFSVVAQEVGNLAKISGEAASKISKIVKDSIATTHEITGENKQLVEDGNKLVKETAQILFEVNDKAKMVRALAKEIETNSQEQSLGIKQINEAILEIDNSTQSNSRLSEESSTLGSQLLDEMDELEKIVCNLNQVIKAQKCESTDSPVDDSEKMENLADS